MRSSNPNLLLVTVRQETQTKIGLVETKFCQNFGHSAKFGKKSELASAMSCLHGISIFGTMKADKTRGQRDAG
jgi:hypothetical protein